MSTRDIYGRNYILLMLGRCLASRPANMGKQFDDNVIRKIQILNSHGVDINSKDDCDRYLSQKVEISRGKRGKLHRND